MSYSMETFKQCNPEEKSVVSKMQKKYWKTKQVLIKVTGKKEDEYVVAYDAELDAKLEFFHSIQVTCTDLLKIIEKYQQRLNVLSKQENGLGDFLKFQAARGEGQINRMLDATGQALYGSSQQRLALRTALSRLGQELATFNQRAVSDTLLTVIRMEEARTEYRGTLLWMKDASQELDPDTFKQMEKFRKVQGQVRNTKTQFDKLKVDVCQKVDLLGTSRCNMLSHCLAVYQMTFLHFCEKTAQKMSEIKEGFASLQPSYSNTSEKLTKQTVGENQENTTGAATISNTDKLILLDEDSCETQLGTDATIHSQPSIFGDDQPCSLEKDWLEDDFERHLSCLEDLSKPSSSDTASTSQAEYPNVFEHPNLWAQGTAAEQQAQVNSGVFLPSQLFDFGFHTAGEFSSWVSQSECQSLSSKSVPDDQLGPSHSTPNVPQRCVDTSSQDLSAWFNALADLDPSQDPDAIGHSDDDLLAA
ncbi:islet cell autoantigen 1-like protein isoform X1 [Pogona vitticeps]